MGVIAGRPGELAAGATMLGYGWSNANKDKNTRRNVRADAARAHGSDASGIAAFFRSPCLVLLSEIAHVALCKISRQLFPYLKKSSLYVGSTKKCVYVGSTKLCVDVCLHQIFDFGTDGQQGLLEPDSVQFIIHSGVPSLFLSVMFKAKANILLPVVALAECVLGGQNRQQTAFVATSGLRLNNYGLEGRCCHKSPGLLSLRSHMVSDGTTPSRRDAIMWAIASGAAGFLGAKQASAAGGSGPAQIDGPSLEKSAISKTAPSVNRNNIKVRYQK
jgi:hypothetical protein